MKELKCNLNRTEKDTILPRRVNQPASQTQGRTENKWLDETSFVIMYQSNYSCKVSKIGDSKLCIVAMMMKWSIAFTSK